MAGSLNKAMVLGNLGRDPDIRTTHSGSKIASFSVATTEKWRDRESGDQRERTEWHRIVIFNDNLVSVVDRYLRKGSRVYVEGELRTRKWTDSASGQDRYSTEIVLQGIRGQFIMLGDSRGGGGGPREERSEGGSGGGSGSGGGGGGSREERSEEGSGGSGGGAGSGKSYGGASHTEDDMEDEVPF